MSWEFSINFVISTDEVCFIDLMVSTFAVCAIFKHNTLSRQFPELVFLCRRRSAKDAVSYALHCTMLNLLLFDQSSWTLNTKTKRRSLVPGHSRF